jgi:hypothetical protein
VPSYYTIAEFVPDPIRGERINVGVIVFGDGMVRSRFLTNWNRVQAFAGNHHISFLKDFAERVQDWAPQQPRLGQVEITDEQLRGITASWMNSIQLTEPRASLLSPDELLRDTAARFLPPVQRRARGRDKRAAATLAYQSLEGALIERGIERPGEVLSKHRQVPGEIESHSFDVVLGNSSEAAAIQGFSFEGSLTAELGKQIEAIAYELRDVRDYNVSLPLSVVALPPRSRFTKSLERAEKIFTAVGAQLVLEPDVGSWASDTARLVTR